MARRKDNPAFHPVIAEMMQRVSEKASCIFGSANETELFANAKALKGQLDALVDLLSMRQARRADVSLWEKKGN